MKVTTRELLRFLIKNTVRALSLLLAVCVISFVLVSASPIDPVRQYILRMGTNVSPEQRAEIEEYWGVDEPAAERLAGYFGNVLRGDLGQSLIYRRAVSDIIAERFKNSIVLMLASWVLSGVIGFLLGCVMGMNRNKLPDKILKRMCLFLSSVPMFWLGLIFLLVFSAFLGWFPIGFSTPIGVASGDVGIFQRIYHLILPSVTLSLMSFSQIALHTREKLCAVLESEYVLFARARGERGITLLFRHGVRNIIIPALTLSFASFSELFGGSVIAENVFSYPGLGSAVSEAGLGGDVPLLLGITLFSALFVFVGNMIADVLASAINPKSGEEKR